MFTFHIQGKLRKKIQLLPIVLRKVKNSQMDIYGEYSTLLNEIKEMYKDKKPSEIELFIPARNLFKSIGIDPTKTRPSSEALLRRVIKGKDIWSVNAIVDIGNISSIESGLPVLTYDIKKIHGLNLSMRIGREGEVYEGIGRGEFNLHKKPVLVDKKGPFGCPISDSVRTSVTLETKKVLFIFVAPIDYDRTTLFLHGLKAINRFTKNCGGSGEILQLVR
jgi:DNA/RNA-binding domain of Phe-tRNA-synthetase-like protein